MNNINRGAVILGARALAVVIFILGALVMLVPLVIFSVCDGAQAVEAGAHGGLHACNNTLYAEIVMSVFVMITGVYVLIRPIGHIVANASIWVIVLAVIVGLLPMAVTGVCTMPSMACRNGTVPGLVVVSVLMIISGIWGSMTVRSQASAAERAMPPGTVRTEKKRPKEPPKSDPPGGLKGIPGFPG